VKCIEHGAEDYLFKPPNPVLLRARVNASLEKKRLRDQQRRLFRAFTTHEIADELLAQGFTLGGKRVHATAMFCDVRDFTTIAESQDPEETISLLNALYALIFDSILSHGGSINQIQGDGVVGIFGAPTSLPDHATQAVRAAKLLRNRIEKFNESNTGQGVPHIVIGIGIATGKMVAGYAGTRDRATYTCIGDTVNLAARLEAHTKVTKTPILIDEFTQRDLPEDIKTTLLGPEVFKGKSMPVNVFVVD
jgi:class 3 adenylate cyclase